MTFEFNTHGLISYLREHDLQPELHKDTGQVFVVYHIQEHEVPVFFLLQTHNGLLQMVAYLPYQIPENKMGETARLLHILNRELDMPGFCLDESQKLLFYRAVLPCFDGKVECRLFNMYLGTARVACDTFMQVIGVIATGTMTLDQALSLNQEKLL